ncbi:hypothetical protein [Adhaeribacter aquaticus]|uniref:hypothetical protein n=1 Tax=Adhaeribacter aquaticus TaxID=299567 RepID=UPI0004296D3C|nr:hypothetical protein [Adhaeribacter aquaticus]
MKYRFLLLLFFLLNSLAFAQTGSDDDPRARFVGLQNGQKIYGKRVQLKSPLLKSNYFLIDDSIRYPVDAVKFYQSDNGFFLKISDVYGGQEFAKRTVAGRISKFYISRVDYNPYGNGAFGYPRYGGFGYGGFGYPGYGYGPSRRNIYFFSKDGGQLQNYTFENLRQAMSDNPGSLEVLAKYRRDKYIDTGLSLAGAAILIAGFTSTIRNTDLQTGVSRVSPMVYAGAGILSIPLVKGLFKKDKLTQAVELYNYQKRD